MKISDAQLISIAANLLSRCIHTPEDLHKINKEHIQKALEITHNIADFVPSLDLNNQKVVKDLIENAFEFLGTEKVSCSTLAQTIKEAAAIGTNAANSVVKKAEGWGFLIPHHEKNKNGVKYCLNISF